MSLFRSGKSSLLQQNRLALLLLMSLLYIAVVQWLWGWSDLLTAWRGMTFWSAVAALLVVLFSYLLRAWRVYDYFYRDMHGRFGECIKLSLNHNLLNNLLPMRSGELSFPLLMSRYFQVEMLRSVSGLFWFRLLDLHTILLFGALAYLSWGYASWPRISVLAFVLFLLLWVVAPLLLFISQRRLHRWLDPRATGRLQKLLLRILAALPQTSAMFWRSWLWTFINWLIKLIAMAWLLQQFLAMPIGAAISGVIAGDLTSVLPVNAPAGVGTYETGVATALLSWSLELDKGYAAAVNLHLFLLSTSLLSGLLAWFIRPRKPRQHVAV